ncbi:MAG: YggS family pyridoxal phosphate-dependent enzyme [Chloroflexi bacterium]|nr:YggS family pyridoxal phosphate-dependent enzyme [Chloroflexota bacterium]
MTNSIATNYQNIIDRVVYSAKIAGRDPDDVKLIVVTKGQPVEKMIEAYKAGARLFGENYPEETEKKLEELRKLDGIEIHMIGHLQSRKAQIVAGSFDWMHSIDRLSIVEKLDRELQNTGRTMPVLLEMNVSGEESKMGFSAWNQNHWNSLIPIIDQIASIKTISIRGLMTMPPLSASAEQTRSYFKVLRELRDYLAGKFKNIKWDELSMGTSGDFEAAIMEGATFIRISTAIMGPRPKKQMEIK